MVHNHGTLPGQVAPDPEAEELAEWMIRQEDVMYDVVSETIESGENGDLTESGRTVCGIGADPRGPLARYPSSVKLDQCPIGGAGGTYHSHVTMDELRRPQNSLPDISNVMWGDIDVSIVVGTQQSEMVIAPADHEQAAMEFQDAMGVEAGDHGDIIDAIIEGRVDPDRARERVRQRMSPLFRRYETSFYELDQRLDGLHGQIPDSVEMNVTMHEAQVHAQQMYGIRSYGHGDRPHEKARRQAMAITDAAADAGVGQMALGAAVGTIVGTIVERAVFGTS